MGSEMCIRDSHPAALLRDPSKKKLVWEDMQIVMKEVGIDV